jgi:GTP cyclohydrolase I
MQEPGNEKDALIRIISNLLYRLGERDRPGLKNTPQRTANAWIEWTSGYQADIPALFTVFNDGAEGTDEMVVVRDIPFYSHCEHHMAPFFGTVTVGYIPDGRIVGLSKINRLVNAYSKRLQVQERITTQIAGALMEHLKPLGCGVVINARHLCMESRGIQQQGHSTMTCALRGVFKEFSTTRQEFLSIARAGL